jgi:hypothetical protein
MHEEVGRAWLSEKNVSRLTLDKYISSLANQLLKNKSTRCRERCVITNEGLARRNEPRLPEEKLKLDVRQLV